MHLNSPILFIEINKSEFVFVVINKSENDNYKILYSGSIPLSGIIETKIMDLESIHNLLREKIYLIEKEINFIFKDVTLIIDNFDCSFINLCGLKKLNGTQLTKENITYILNSLKSQVNDFEPTKEIIQIFNCKFFLDNKKIENIPVGLFGDNYLHELSFILLNKNDYKNLKNILNKCNLKITKIYSKNFISGVETIKKNTGLETFLKIEINSNDSKIIFFEDSALKFVQEFNFGSDIILQDISKVTGLRNKNVEDVLLNSNFSDKNLENDLIEKKYFGNQNYRKIKKKLIFEIADARIKEISEIIFIKNINFNFYLKKKLPVFLKIGDSPQNFFKGSYLQYFSKDTFNVIFENELISKNMFYNAYEIVQFGWKKEAVPIVHEKKSLIARFFNWLFG